MSKPKKKERKGERREEGKVKRMMSSLLLDHKMEGALRELANGSPLSVASSKFGIANSTLWDRATGFGIFKSETQTGKKNRMRYRLFRNHPLYVHSDDEKEREEEEEGEGEEEEEEEEGGVVELRKGEEKLWPFLVQDEPADDRWFPCRVVQQGLSDEEVSKQTDKTIGLTFPLMVQFKDGEESTRLILHPNLIARNCLPSVSLKKNMRVCVPWVEDFGENSCYYQASFLGRYTDPKNRQLVEVCFDDEKVVFRSLSVLRLLPSTNQKWESEEQKKKRLQKEERRLKLLQMEEFQFPKKRRGEEEEEDDDDELLFLSSYPKRKRADSFSQNKKAKQDTYTKISGLTPITNRPKTKNFPPLLMDPIKSCGVNGSVFAKRFSPDDRWFHGYVVSRFGGRDCGVGNGVVGNGVVDNGVIENGVIDNGVVDDDRGVVDLDVVNRDDVDHVHEDGHDDVDGDVDSGDVNRDEIGPTPSTPPLSLHVNGNGNGNGAGVGDEQYLEGGDEEHPFSCLVVFSKDVQEWVDKDSIIENKIPELKDLNVGHQVACKLSNPFCLYEGEIIFISRKQCIVRLLDGEIRTILDFSDIRKLENEQQTED